MNQSDPESPNVNLVLGHAPMRLQAARVQQEVLQTVPPSEDPLAFCYTMLLWFTKAMRELGLGLRIMSNCQALEADLGLGLTCVLQLTSRMTT